MVQRLGHLTCLVESPVNHSLSYGLAVRSSICALTSSKCTNTQYLDTLESRPGMSNSKY